MNKRMKITDKQRDELLRLYLSDGREAAGALAVKYGVSPKYPSSLAAALGLHRPRWRKGNRYKDNKIDHTRSLNDPRWAWAIERGSVTV